MMNHLRIEGVAPLGRTPSFAAQLPGAPRQRCVSAQRRDPSDRARQLMRRVDAATPMTLDTNLFRGAEDLDQDPFDEQAHDGLALLLRRGFGAPERGQILRQIRIATSSAVEGASLRALDALMLGLETGLFGQGLLSVAFERARHQPVLGLHGGILPARALDLVAARSSRCRQWRSSAARSASRLSASARLASIAAGSSACKTSRLPLRFDPPAPPNQA
jgi:hypothetical protein